MPRKPPLPEVEAILAALAEQARPWAGCTGAGNCPEAWHEHGCYADTGQCNEPLDHHAGATADPAPASEVRDDEWDEDDYTDVAGNPDPPFDVPGNPWEQ